MKVTGLVLLHILLASAAAMANSEGSYCDDTEGLLSCAPNGTIVRLEKLASSGDRTAQRELSVVPAKDFCSLNEKAVTVGNHFKYGYGLFLKQTNTYDAIKFIDSNVETLPLSQLDHSIGSLDPWELVLYPSEHLRRLALREPFRETLNPDHRNSSLGQISKVLSGQISPKGFFFPENNGHPLINLDDIAKLPPEYAGELNSYKGKLAEMTFCAKNMVGSESSCVDVLRQVVDLMMPRSIPGSNEEFLLIPVIRELLNDPSYAAGIKHAASVVLNLILRSQNTETGNIFDLLVSSFREQGLNKQEAEEHTWNVLAVSSIKGPNTYRILLDLRPSRNISYEDDQMLKLGIGILAIGGSILDARLIAQQKKHLFSFPKTVETTCDLGKSYHFWMSAFLARYVGKALKSASIGKNFAWNLETIYQMKSTTQGRNPLRAFQVQTFDPQNNSIRMDLAFANGGAVFGAASLQQQTEDHIDIDDILSKLIFNAEPQVPESTHKATEEWSGMGLGGVVKWRELFAPSSI